VGDHRLDHLALAIARDRGGALDGVGQLDAAAAQRQRPALRFVMVWTYGPQPIRYDRRRDRTTGRARRRGRTRMPTANRGSSSNTTIV
jgi:hypothetical protein